MKNLFKTYPKHRIFLFLAHAVLFISLWLWFNPITQAWLQEIDKAVFEFLNGSLSLHRSWQWFWGILNHRKETTYNLVIAALFNVWAILQTKDLELRKARIKQLIYFWICFQIGFMIQDYFFNTFLVVERLSPSLVIEPAIRLSELLYNPNIKDFSEHSFPSGHAFALIYWASFTLLCSPKRLGKIGLFLALFLCLPRLFSGAHWISDTLFSALLAIAWLSWTLNIPIYYQLISPRQSLKTLRQPQ